MASLATPVVDDVPKLVVQPPTPMTMRTYPSSNKIQPLYQPSMAFFETYELKAGESPDTSLLLPPRRFPPQQRRNRVRHTFHQPRAPFIGLALVALAIILTMTSVISLSSPHPGSAIGGQGRHFQVLEGMTQALSSRLRLVMQVGIDKRTWRDMTVGDIFHHTFPVGGQVPIVETGKEGSQAENTTETVKHEGDGEIEPTTLTEDTMERQSGRFATRALSPHAWRDYQRKREVDERSHSHMDFWDSHY